MNARWIGVAVALAACVIGGLTGGVASGGEKAKTKLKMTMTCKFGDCEKARRASTPADFSGKVKSKNSACVAGRQVKVIRKGGAPNPGPIGTTTANANGQWNLHEEGALEGTYKARTGKASGCKTGKSKKWTLNFARGARAGQTTVARAPRAHNQEFETTITIKRTPSFVYKGKVISDSDDCVKNRRVTLFAREDGTDAVFVIAHDRTDQKGRWSYQVVGDGYYAEAKERVVTRGDHKHTCLFDRSPTTPPRR
jgi:hypothetical protein